MATSPIPLISFEEYLALEEKAQFKNEFYQGQILAMSGGTLRHSLIQSNLSRRLSNALDGTDCQVHSGGLLFRTGIQGLGAYPDIMVLCGQPKLEDGRELVVLNPKVLVEVLSPSTETYDRRTKADEYWKCPSVQQYFLISQTRPLVEIQTRQADGQVKSDWIEGREAICPFESLGLSIPMTEIYERVNF
jgi:Uma2 family endonuclease